MMLAVGIIEVLFNIHIYIVPYVLYIRMYVQHMYVSFVMYITAWCVEVVTGTVFAGVSSTFCQPDSRGMQLPRQPLSRHYRATAEECGPATSPV